MRSSRTMIGLCCLGIVLLAGCTGSGRSGSGVAARAGSEAQPAVGAPVAGSGSDGGAAAGTRASAGSGNAAVAPSPGITSAPTQSRDYVRTASLAMRVHDVDSAAADVLSLAAAASARVDGDTRSGEGADRQARIVVRVTPDRLSGLIVSVDHLGRELDRTDNGTDVTATRADINARTQALQTSIGRLTELLRHSGSITDLVTLEDDLTQRESALESMQAQQRSLADQIALSTLTVQLTRDPNPPMPAVVHARSGPAGFGTALVRGARGLLLALRWLSALAGYLLPFAAVLGVGIAGVLAALRRRAQRQVSPAEAGPVATP